jgi:hypothetical protein
VDGKEYERNVCIILMGKPFGKLHLENREAYWDIMLRWIVGILVMWLGGGRKQLRAVSDGGVCY